MFRSTPSTPTFSFSAPQAPLTKSEECEFPLIQKDFKRDMLIARAYTIFANLAGYIKPSVHEWIRTESNFISDLLFELELPELQALITRMTFQAPSSDNPYSCVGHTQSKPYRIMKNIIDCQEHYIERLKIRREELETEQRKLANIQDELKNSSPTLFSELSIQRKMYNCLENIEYIKNALLEITSLLNIIFLVLGEGQLIPLYASLTHVQHPHIVTGHSVATQFSREFNMNYYLIFHNTLMEDSFDERYGVGYSAQRKVNLNELANLCNRGRQLLPQLRQMTQKYLNERPSTQAITISQGQMNDSNTRSQASITKTPSLKGHFPGKYSADNGFKHSVYTLFLGFYISEKTLKDRHHTKAVMQYLATPDDAYLNVIKNEIENPHGLCATLLMLADWYIDTVETSLALQFNPSCIPADRISLTPAYDESTSTAIPTSGGASGGPGMTPAAPNQRPATPHDTSESDDSDEDTDSDDSSHSSDTKSEDQKFTTPAKPSHPRPATPIQTPEATLAQKVSTAFASLFNRSNPTPPQSAPPENLGRTPLGGDKQGTSSTPSTITIEMGAFRSAPTPDRAGAKLRSTGAAAGSAGAAAGSGQSAHSDGIDWDL